MLEIDYRMRKRRNGKTPRLQENVNTGERRHAFLRGIAVGVGDNSLQRGSGALEMRAERGSGHLGKQPLGARTLLEAIEGIPGALPQSDSEVFRGFGRLFWCSFEAKK